MIEQRKYIEGYNCVGSSLLGYYVGVLLGFRPGVNPGWEERNTVGLEPGYTPVAYIINYDGLRCRK